MTKNRRRQERGGLARGERSSLKPTKPRGHMKPSNTTLAATCACAALLAGGALAQQFVYPAKGQSADLQKKDESACHQWAVQQTGFDPAKPPPPCGREASQPPRPARRRARAHVARRVVRSSVGCAGDASAGAAVGAAVARRQSRRQNAAAGQQQQAATQQPAGRVRQGARGLPRGSRVYGQVSVLSGCRQGCRQWRAL